ncbi:hypothetical protein QE152_g38028 [Popillia japonica]|uniref:Uncharacterized protein n=1 Tax=Popillia japonica TaxID=7064 RepID=A0AAW1I8W1_POPJA
MGSIDKIDMLLSSTECVRKSVEKWYKKLFFHLADLAVVYAHAMYKVKTGINISLADFQLERIRQLISTYQTSKIKSKGGRPSAGDIPSRLIDPYPAERRTHNVYVMFENARKIVLEKEKIAGTFALIATLDYA